MLRRLIDRIKTFLNKEEKNEFKSEIRDFDSERDDYIQRLETFEMLIHLRMLKYLLDDSFREEGGNDS